MKSRTQLLIAFCSAAVVTMVAVSETRRTSPGRLASVHQREPDLAGPNDCSECHGGFFGRIFVGGMREACLECHAPIEAQLEDESGLHGTLGARAEQCGLCHSEHHGESAPLVHGQSFALAGVPKIAEFDHQLVGFVLDGAHRPLECTECHANARVPILPQGETRFLGLDRDCASCHEDPHEGQRAAACASCHGQETWDGLFALGHERVLPLIGGHGDLACTECHAPDGPHALEIVGGKGERRERGCIACHESPHTPDFAKGGAVLAGLPPGRGCVSCHAAEHTTFHDPALRTMTPEQHAVSGFPLDVPHDTVECADCHSTQLDEFGERYPGRSPEQCSACHADVHEGQFETGPFAGEECTACHESTRFDPHAFDAEHHALAALDLTGRHLEIECAECHARPDEDAARVFRGTPALCDACHADAHDGFFADFVADLAAPAHGECEHCHDTTRFASAETDFDHDAFTGFPVLGAHAESDCAACHHPSPQPDGAGRSFGRVSVQFGPFQGCVTCHADPHAGSFDVELGLPAEVEGRTDCARCHSESSFRALPRDFDHGFWTGFALAGAHASAACSTCHPPIPGAARQGRSAAEALGSGCADCHEDPHAGQFVEPTPAGGPADCARCHDPARTDFVGFDHERDSRFALGDAHRALDCAVCHPTTLRGGLPVVHYRPLGSECVDCHGSNAEVLLRRQPRNR